MICSSTPCFSFTPIGSPIRCNGTVTSIFWPLTRPRQVGMDQTAFNRIDLPIVKHDFTLADALDLDREDRVSSGF
jgi:hypothetical protein